MAKAKKVVKKRKRNPRRNKPQTGSKASAIYELLDANPKLIAAECVEQMENRGISCSKSNFYQARATWKKMGGKRRAGANKPIAQIDLTEPLEDSSSILPADLASMPTERALYVLLERHQALEQECQRISGNNDALRTTLLTLQ